MSTSSKRYQYDVFISFRGEETRKGFTSDLHKALCEGKINAYIDEYLTKGEDIWPSLCKAIENSRIAIVVFSRDYATSRWCLRELVKILECRKDESHRQVVLPVFYGVDPSNIRKQTGSYGEAFYKYELILQQNSDNEDMREEVFGWKDALTKAANISGWDSSNYEEDSQLIGEIVQNVSKKQDLFSSYEDEVKGLVGIEEICEDVKLLLSKDPKENSVPENGRVIGIWGMGGTGKTTIARVVFCQISSQYDNVCFFQDVREEYKRVGLPLLCRRLISELLKDENLNYNHGSTFTTGMLRNKKVLLVLDDVDSVDQLDGLCKEYKYASAGSTLIITTRIRHLLSGRVDEDDIHEVKTWSFDKSLNLFSLHALKKRDPPKGYEDFAKRAVEYAQGVPLALKVLGSHLCPLKEEKFWDEELEKLKNNPLDNIQSVLRVSYDGLDDLQREIFLDIAFFFKGEKKEYVERILNACGLYATSGIEMLRGKALLTISNRKIIQMHDLLQEMGMKIVREKDANPGKRSRLRDNEAVFDVLKYNKGSDLVEGIKLDLSEIHNLHLNVDSFNMMTNLRFLILYTPSGKKSGNVTYPRVFNKFPDKLRYFEWHGYRLKSLPPTFSAKMLVHIRLPHSHFTELWSGVKDVMNLEGIDLSECKQLNNLPNFSKASKLKWVNLTGCERLSTVHPSFLSLDTLETLILKNCKKLRSLKSEKHLKSLKTINVDGCTSLKEFSVSSNLLGRLDLRNTGIEKLDPSIGSLGALWSLNLEGLRLRNLPNEISSLKNLFHLNISDCRLVIDREKLHLLFDGLRDLETLYLKDCCNLFELPDNISNLTCLSDLRLDRSGLKRLPARIKHLPKLRILSLENCTKLGCLPELPKLIKMFNAMNCRSLVTISTVKSFEGSMIGRVKFISFQNCMKLDRPSLRFIREDALSLIFRAVNDNAEATMYNAQFHGYEYTSIQVCFPGSTVPGQFKYCTAHSSMTINLPSYDHLHGVILCVVLSPSQELKKHGAKIFCQCYLENGTKLGCATSWHKNVITNLNSDHVYMWYDAFYRGSIAKNYDQRVSFKFYVANDQGERDVLNTSIKDYGVSLVFDPESQRTAAITELEASDEERCNDVVNNQDGGGWLRHSFYIGLCLDTILSCCRHLGDCFLMSSCL